jgi:hypothetical protein
MGCRKRRKRRPPRKANRLVTAPKRDLKEERKVRMGMWFRRRKPPRKVTKHPLCV